MQKRALLGNIALFLVRQDSQWLTIDLPRAGSYFPCANVPINQDGNPFLVARLLISWLLGGTSSLTPCKMNGDDSPGEGERSNDSAGFEERL